MAENKTQPTKESALKYCKSLENETRRKDALVLLKLFKEITGKKPVMWGESIVGFNQYHYSYSSGKEGNWPMTGFSARKTGMAIYLMMGVKNYPELLSKLGKHKHGSSCLNIVKLEDVDLKILAKMIKLDYAKMVKKYTKSA